MKRNHSIKLTIEYVDYEIDVDIEVQSAEPDVGIMGDYIEDWSVTSVNGDTSQSAIDAMHILIEAEYGDELFIQKLYDDGACDRDDDGDYD